MIREFRPHVMTTYDENGGYPHPDHIKCHDGLDGGVRTRPPTPALPARGRALAAAEDLLQPDDCPGAHRSVPRASWPAGIESPYGEWLKDWEDAPEREITTRVECAEYFDLRDRALLAHATQVDPDGGWFHAPRDMVREGWPTEEYELASSYVPVQLPEDDLFAGLGSVREADALAVKRSGPVRDIAGPDGAEGWPARRERLPDGHPSTSIGPGWARSSRSSSSRSCCGCSCAT